MTAQLLSERVGPTLVLTISNPQARNALHPDIYAACKVALQAAADEGILSVGVDSNQNHLHPGKVLTSMLKRVDVAVYNSFKAGDALDMTPQALDLKSEGVGYALDDNNAALITPEMKAAVDAAAEKIKSGELKVHDYMSDNTCPAATF